MKLIFKILLILTAKTNIPHMIGRKAKVGFEIYFSKNNKTMLSLSLNGILLFSDIIAVFIGIKYYKFVSGNNPQSGLCITYNNTPVLHFILANYNNMV